MTDLEMIKEKIYNEEKIDIVLEAMGCEYVNNETNFYTARLPERFYSGSNNRSVQVKKTERLQCAIRNRPEFSGDIFFLVSYIHHNKRGYEEFKSDIPNSKKFICETLGWEHFLSGNYKTQKKKDYTACLKSLLGNKMKQQEVLPNPILPEYILDVYYPFGKPLAYHKWIEEGISVETQDFYGVGFDLDSKRVIIPMRNRFGQLVGTKGRILRDEDDKDRKYIYIDRFSNHLEWFNFFIAHPYILMEKRVYIFEAEKSPMMLFDKGVYNSIAIGSSEISLEQAKTIKQLGLDIELVLCYDKGIGFEEIQKQAEKFKGRKVYALYDTIGLLKDKESPIDNGIEVFNKLIENCLIEIEL